MREFWKGCKQRPLVLWILFFVWFALCTAISVFTICVTHTAWGVLCFAFLSLPIIHLLLYVKPLLLLEVFQIIFMYLAVISTIASGFFSAASTWKFVVLIVLCWLIAGALIFVEVRLAKRGRGKYIH